MIGLRLGYIVRVRRSYIFKGPVETEIWPGKSEGLLEGKREKSEAQIR